MQKSLIIASVDPVRAIVLLGLGGFITFKGYVA